MLRVGYSQNQSSRSNLGIGGFDLAERAYASESRGNQLRMQEAGPVGKNAFLNTRLQLRLNENSSVSQLEAPTIRVLDGFTSGGAQVQGRPQSEGHRAVLGSQLRARHPHDAHRHPARGPSLSIGRCEQLPGHVYLLEPARFRAGPAAELHAPHRRSADHLFASRSGGLRPGRSAAAAEPDVQPWASLRSADARPRSHGLRAAPRPDVGAGQERPHHHSHELWACSTTGLAATSTSRRCASTASASRKSTSSIRRIRIRSSRIPPPPGKPSSATSTCWATCRWSASYRYSAAIDRTLSPKVRTSVTFAIGRYSNQLRGVNLNAPVNGVRPDPAFANVIVVTSGRVDAHHRRGAGLQHQLRRRRPQRQYARNGIRSAR